MKKTLLRKVHLIKKPQFYFGVLILLLMTGFSDAATLSHKSSLSHLAVEIVNADVITVKGKITDVSTGQSIPGATIRVKSSQVGVVTDINGNFSIQAPTNAILLISFIGYDPIEVPVNGRTELNVSLTLSNKNLNEVVVVGYGIQKKNAITAAVSTINTETIAQKPVPNLTNSFVGRASGVIVTQASAEPGYDGGNITIRGVGSTGSSKALTIVDGVPRDFSLLDPNSIATISILKDAAAVAPYGVAGANGVILITTKQGRAGKATLTYNGYVGFQNPTRVPTFVNSYQYAQMRNEANINDNSAAAAAGTLLPIYTPAQVELFRNHSDPDIYSDGDPIKQIIQPNRLLTNHNLTLSGGNDDVKYFSSVGYTHQDGYWSTTYLDRYNATLNVTAKATATTSVGINLNGYVQDGHYPGTAAGSIIDQAMRQAPYSPIYYSNGENSGYIGQSLIGEIYKSGYALNENTAIYSQLFIDQKLPIRGLSIKAVANYDSGQDPLFSGQNTSFNRAWNTPIPFYNATQATVGGPIVYTGNIQGSPKSKFTETSSQNHTLTYQGLLNYNGSFGKSDISAVAVFEYKNVNYETFSATRINYNLNIDELNFGGPLATDETNSGSSAGQKQIGYVYRLDYTYDKKYTLEGSGRYDGSYLFPPDHRFGFFPAFSASWRISEEKFIKGNFNWIDNLKLRGSWGQSGAYPGSSGNPATYQYLNQYNVSGSSGVIGNNITQGIYEALQGNANFTWEKSNKTDIGLEGSLFRGVLGFEADYFLDKRSSILLVPTGLLPDEYGIGLGPVNAGKMTNHGVDITLTSFKQFSNDLRLDIKGTFTFARNKILQEDESPATLNNPNQSRTGRPLGTQFGLKAIGYFTDADFVDPGAQNPVLKPGIPVPSFGTVRPGDIQYADINGDGKIDHGNDDVVIGHPNTPEIIYGLEPRLTYKNFDLDLLFQGSGNSDLYVNNYFVWPFQSSGSATELSYTDHWTPSNPNALYPRLSGTPTTNNTQESSWWIRNVAYIRMKSFEVGYTFPNRLLGKSMHSLRLYVAGQNVFTWTPSTKETVDPEEGGNNENYFQQRVISIGVNAAF